jgi:hypothetical protein
MNLRLCAEYSAARLGQRVTFPEQFLMVDYAIGVPDSKHLGTTADRFPSIVQHRAIAARRDAKRCHWLRP